MPYMANAVQVPSETSLARLLAFPAGLQDITFDQLRTLVVVHDTGSALAAARSLGREQSSVQKQLDILNRVFQRLCGELLVIKQGRGQPFLFTPTGASVVEHARGLLAEWHSQVNDASRRIGRLLTVGATEFTLQFIAHVWERVADEFQSREIELKVLHTRTKDSFRRLDAKDVDLLCGTFPAAVGTNNVHQRYEFLEWHREKLILLTNLPKRELPVPAIGARRLSEVPLIIPSSGVIAEFLRRWYGPGFTDRLSITATIDDIYYGLALLRSHMAYGCMIVSQTIGAAAMSGELPGGPGLRLVSLENDFTPALDLVIGVFARAGERRRFAADHPLNLLWDAFAAEVRSGSPVSI